MAQYIINDPEDLLVCPYDAVHLVRAKRFQYHLMKCRRNYLGHDFAVCPFNACHEMPRPELRYHIANCSDKALVEQEVVHNQMRNLEEEGTYFKGDTSVPPYHHDNILLNPTEDWDTELPKYPSFRGNYDLFKDGDLELPCGMTLEERESLQEKIRQEFDRRIKGLEGETSESDTDYSSPELRLPHRQPIAVKHTDRLGLAGVGRGGPTPGSLGMPPANKVRSGRLVNTPLKMLKGKLVEAQYLREQAALLQSLSRGRGIGRGTSLESVVGPQFVIPKVDFSVSRESSFYTDSQTETETETETEIETDLETETTVEPLSCSSTDVETETELDLSETETEKGDDEDLPPPLIGDDPLPLIEDRPPPLIGDDPLPLIEDRPPALIEDRPPALIEDRPPALIEDRPPALIEDRPPALIEDRPPALIEDRPPALIEDRPPALIEDRPPALIGDDEEEKEKENGREEDKLRKTKVL